MKVEKEGISADFKLVRRYLFTYLNVVIITGVLKRLSSSWKQRYVILKGDVIYVYHQLRNTNDKVCYIQVILLISI